MHGLMVVVEFLVGCSVLAWSADRFVNSSVSIAHHFKISPMIVGLVLVGFGTSFPELVVCFLASLHHQPGIAIGNVIGSNIANKALVGGVAALFIPMTIHSRILRRELPFLLVTGLIVGCFFWTGWFGYLAGSVLLCLFFFYLAWMMYMANMERKHKSNDELLVGAVASIDCMPSVNMWSAFFWFLLSLGLLVASSELIVDAATTLAHWLHISDFIIGLTIVAIGTSLPELAATVVSSLKKQHDLAIGNVVGSSIFNLLLALPMAGLVSPSRLPSTIFYRDYPVMMIITFLFWLLALLNPRQKKISRWGGVVLLLCYVIYAVILSFTFKILG